MGVESVALVLMLSIVYCTTSAYAAMPTPWFVHLHMSCVYSFTVLFFAGKRGVSPRTQFYLVPRGLWQLDSCCLRVLLNRIEVR
jgi:hypothetical protein